MYSLPILKVILVLCFLHFPCKIRAEEKVEVLQVSLSAVPLSSTESASPSSDVSTSSPTESHSIQPVTESICTMSLITSKGNEEPVYKRCICDDMRRDVDCSHLEITELPNSISFPKNVQIANFQGNKIGSLKKDTFYNAREIIELDMSYNSIDFISISTFLAFKKLVRLDLSHNRIWSLPKGMFEGLGDLRRLDLSFNDLSNVFPNHYSKLTELRVLILKSNPLKELEPKHFEHMAKLEHLDLESTLLKVIPDHVFAFTPKLKFLKLDNNQLTQVPTKALNVLDQLKVLDLSGNPIETIHEQAFLGLKLLVNLYMDRMPRLTYIENYAFGNMEHLQEMHCSYNFMLNDISPYAFVNKFNNQKVPLSQLFLRQNDLRKISHSLLDWNQGLELHVRDNPLNCDCHTAWMVNIKLKNNFQSHAKCFTPAELENVPLSELKGQELGCGLQLSDIILIVCGVFTGLLILALIVSFLFWRRNYRGYTKPFFYPVKRNHVNEIDYTGGDDGI